MHCVLYSRTDSFNIQYSVQCTVYYIHVQTVSIFSTVYNALCIIFTYRQFQHSVQCTMHCVLYSRTDGFNIQYSVQCTVYIHVQTVSIFSTVQWGTMHCVLYSRYRRFQYSVQCTMHCVYSRTDGFNIQYSVYNALCIFTYIRFQYLVQWCTMHCVLYVFTYRRFQYSVQCPCTMHCVYLRTDGFNIQYSVQCTVYIYVQTVSIFSTVYNALCIFTYRRFQYSVQWCTMHCVYSRTDGFNIQYSVQCNLYITYRRFQYSVQWCTMHCVLYSRTDGFNIQYVVYNALCIICIHVQTVSIFSTVVYNALCIFMHRRFQYLVQCTMHCVLYSRTDSFNI
jgi:hypothetical protein